MLFLEPAISIRLVLRDSEQTFTEELLFTRIDEHIPMCGREHFLRCLGVVVEAQWVAQRRTFN